MAPTTPKVRGRRRAVVLILAAMCATPASVRGTAPEQEVKPLLVADVGRLSSDERLLFAAAQGIVNRSGPTIYLEGVRGGVDPLDERWLRDAVPRAVERVPAYDILTRFRALFRGLVVWDPDLPVDTQNVATTMAGLDDLLPASPALAVTLARPPFGLGVAFDLRTLKLRTRAEAYEWALHNLGPPERFPLIAWLGGNRGGGVGQHGLRDLIVARRGFAFDVEPIREGLLATRILDAFPAGIPVFGYPFFNDPVYESTGLPFGEPFGVGEISRSGKMLIPSTESTNLTVHSWFAETLERPPWDDHPRAADISKTYVAFLITDGDNLGYNQTALRTRHWEDPARGSIPMGVSISPQLAVYAPRIYNYYVRTLSPNDVLVAGPSGAGYIYPQIHPDLDAFLRDTRRLMDRTGLRALWILDNGYASSPSPLIIDRYVDALKPAAIFTDYFGFVVPNPPPVYFWKGTPVVHALWGDGVAPTVGKIRLASASYPGRPAFVLVALNTWTMGYAQARQIMEALGPSYEVVRPDHFIGLLEGASILGSAPRVP